MRWQPVRVGAREADCPLCAMSDQELLDFWGELLEHGEAFALDGLGGVHRYDRAELLGDPHGHVTPARRN